MQEIDEPIHLSDYRDSWPAQFAEERLRLAVLLGLSPEKFQHIGSTAVPGLIAKPIVDIMLGVPDLPVPQWTQVLQGLGYEYLGEAGVPGRHYYRRRGVLQFNLQVVESNGPHWIKNIALRDYLRRDPTARDRYGEAKRGAVAAGCNTLLAYSQFKGPVVEALLRQAVSTNSNYNSHGIRGPTLP
jgi:GrpB-like predicted nucleotidyltransferase (UPF0157 family)